MYLKENPNQQYHAYLFSMCQSKVSEWVNFILPVLEDTLISLSVMPQSGYEYCQDTDEDLLVDVTEREVPRQTDHESQKEEYSGKKKRHSIKNLAITNTNGFVNFISDYYLGTTHDKSIWDDLILKFKNCSLYADLGFKGIEDSNLTIIMPHKKQRKSSLTEKQKSENKEISSKRITIEHTFGKMKIFKMIRNKIRLKRYDIRDTVFRISAAIHNLRIISKNHITNET
ncbi:MAG: transposase [Bacteroidales bacterium]|nr:transposase [Bacteroidales bacterium]